VGSTERSQGVDGAHFIHKHFSIKGNYSRGWHMMFYSILSNLRLPLAYDVLFYLLFFLLYLTFFFWVDEIFVFIADKISLESLKKNILLHYISNLVD